MNRYLLPCLLIAAGMAVMAVATAWPRLASNPNWTPEQAQAYEQAMRQYNRAAPPAAAEDSPSPPDPAVERYRKLRQQREEALGARVWASMLLQMLGVGLGLIGSVWLILRQNEAQDARDAEETPESA